jgi:hypothetical protein
MADRHFRLLSKDLPILLSVLQFCAEVQPHSNLSEAFGGAQGFAILLAAAKMEILFSCVMLAERDFVILKFWQG